jgi:BASS family bile acid:Na+ symporter
MDPVTLLKLAIVTSIVLIVVSIGMHVPQGTALRFLKDPAPASKAMLAMFVAMPLFTLLVTWLLPLEPPVRIALLALSLSPMPPILPRKEAKEGASMDFAIGIQVAAMVTALVAAPLFAWLFGQVFGRSVPFQIGPMLQVLLLTVGGPLAVGILVKRFAPDFAIAWRDRIGKAGTLLLAVGVLVILAATWHGIWGAVGNGTLLAILLMTGFALVVGHLLGGPEPGNRSALATATASRHPGVAIALGSMADPAHFQAILGAVLLYLLAGAAFSLPYSRWAKARGG